MLRILAVTTVITALSALTEPEDRGVRGRQFSLLSILSFRNSECVSGTEGTLGECYTAAECRARGGTSQSTCASGVGVCCYVVQQSCLTDNEIVYNNTYIRSVSSACPPPPTSSSGTSDTPGASAQEGPAHTGSDPVSRTSVSSDWTSSPWTW